MKTQIIQNLKHLPSTIFGLAMIIAALPQADAIQKVMALSPKVANAITTAACIAGGVAAVILIGQKTFKGENQ